MSALNSRISESVQDSLVLQVEYSDLLGEGPGSWDPDPRTPAGQVNCLTWLQYILASAYARKPEDLMPALDSIRYHEGIVSFAYRKHFVDRWTSLSTGPLRAVDIQECLPDRKQHVKLDLNRFKKSTGYLCSLYAENQRTFDIDFLSIDRLNSCTKSLVPGHYVMFGIASEKYLKRYGRLSGPMAQVHAFLLQIAGDRSKQPVVFHASVSKGMVIRETLSQMIDNQSGLHLGYSLYRLDATWAYKPGPIGTRGDDAAAILTCEKGLKGRARETFEQKREVP